MVWFGVEYGVKSSLRHDVVVRKRSSRGLSKMKAAEW